MTKCTDAWTWRRGSQGSLTVGRVLLRGCQPAVQGRQDLQARTLQARTLQEQQQQKCQAAFISLAVNRLSEQQSFAYAAALAAVCPLEDVLSVLRRRWYDGLNLEGEAGVFTACGLQGSTAPLRLQPIVCAAFKNFLEGSECRHCTLPASLAGFLRAFRALLRERTTVRMQQSAAALSLEPTGSSGSSSASSSSSTGRNSSGASNC